MIFRLTKAIKMETYTIYWKDYYGNVRHGTQSISYILATEWLNYLKKRHPDIEHWIESTPAV